MGDIQDTKKWINERLIYIAQNCDLNESENKRALASLQTALKCIEKVEGEKSNGDKK